MLYIYTIFNSLFSFLFFFFFNDTATTEIYTLSLHDALPIRRCRLDVGWLQGRQLHHRFLRDRKSTRLNSSHVSISYAVFCLKKKKQTNVIFFLKKKKKQKQHILKNHITP